MRIANPDKTHVIRWQSTVTGGKGTGTKLFEQEEAERLAAELNEQYPDIDHEAVIPSAPVAEPPAATPDSTILSTEPISADPIILSDR